MLMVFLSIFLEGQEHFYLSSLGGNHDRRRHGDRAGEAMKLERIWSVLSAFMMQLQVCFFFFFFLTVLIKDVH